MLKTHAERERERKREREREREATIETLALRSNTWLQWKRTRQSERQTKWKLQLRMPSGTWRFSEQRPLQNPPQTVWITALLTASISFGYVAKWQLVRKRLQATATLCVGRWRYVSFDFTSESPSVSTVTVLTGIFTVVSPWQIIEPTN